MTTVQRRRDALAAQLAPPPPGLDRRALRQALAGRLADWQVILRRNIVGSVVAVALASTPKG